MVGQVILTGKSNTGKNNGNNNNETHLLSSHYTPVTWASVPAHRVAVRIPGVHVDKTRRTASSMKDVVSEQQLFGPHALLCMVVGPPRVVIKALLVRVLETT